MEESLAKPIERLNQQIAILGEKIKGTQSIVPSEGGSTFKDKEPLAPNLTPTEVNREKQKAVVFGKALGIGVYTPKGKLEDLTPDAIKTVTASATVAKQQEAGLGILKLIGGILGVGANLLALTSAYKFLREWIPKIFGPGAKGIFDTLDTFFQPIIDFVDDMKQKFMDWFKETFPETYKFLEDTVNSIKEFFISLDEKWKWFVYGADSPLAGFPTMQKFFQNVDTFFRDIDKNTKWLWEGETGEGKFKGLKNLFVSMTDYFTKAGGFLDDLKKITGYLEVVAKNLYYMVTRPKDYAYNLAVFGQGIVADKERSEIRKKSAKETGIRFAKNMYPGGRLGYEIAQGIGKYIVEWTKPKNNPNYNPLNTSEPATNYRPPLMNDAVFKNGKVYGISNDDDIMALKSGGPLDRIFKKQDNMMVSYSRSLLEATMKQIELLARIENNTAVANQLLSKQKPTIVQSGSRDSGKQRIFNRKDYDVDSSPLFDYKLLV